jgi:hypothetical protein
VAQVFGQTASEAQLGVGDDEQPGRAVRQPGVQPVPGAGFGLAVVGGVRRGGRCGLGPGGGVGKGELAGVVFVRLSVSEMVLAPPHAWTKAVTTRRDGSQV